MKQLIQAFIKAKREFGPALKDKTNPAFRSKYADLGACIDAVEDALLNNGIAFVQETCEDATGVTVETVLLHESGDERRCGKLHVPASKQDPQGYGSALTYARRYSLMAACGIAPEDDDGNAASKPKPTSRGVKADVLETSGGIPDARKAELEKVASRVQDAFDAYGPQAAYEVIAEEGLSDLDKIQLAVQLGSTVSNKIKQYSVSLHTKATA